MSLFLTILGYVDFLTFLWPFSSTRKEFQHLNMPSGHASISFMASFFLFHSHFGSTNTAPSGSASKVPSNWSNLRYAGRIYVIYRYLAICMILARIGQEHATSSFIACCTGQTCPLRTLAFSSRVVIKTLL